MRDVDPTLPPGVLLSWGLVEASGRGRRPAIQASDIVAAAVALADAEGLAGISMPRVGRAVGVTQNALYRHVASKDELLVLAADMASGDPPPLPAGAGWRANARAWVSALVERYTAHPWLLEVRIRTPFTRNSVRWTEALLRGTRDTGLPVERRVRCALLLDGHARYVAALRRDLAGQELAYRAARATLAPLLAERGCTDFAAFLAGPEADADGGDPADDVEFGLERILDGIDALLARDSGTPTSR